MKMLYSISNIRWKIAANVIPKRKIVFCKYDGEKHDTIAKNANNGNSVPAVERMHGKGAVNGKRTFPISPSSLQTIP